MSDLTHIDRDGRPRMVDVGAKPITDRVARASGMVRMSAAGMEAVANGGSKGDVCRIAELAGIMAAKKTADLIPLCHPLPLTSVKLRVWPDAAASAVRIEAEAACSGRTGVEMEALTAVSVAALTVYDMVKAVDRSMVIDAVRLDAKQGGRSGDWERAD
ncbi:cyclic pyranopterin monophosphate synthase MoaC [Sphingomonas jaspsi]|uniref:cyclic pyranopterin monophosphate synthase MoaC n=1 Tax=Sphingomonas jaspsi TaxID=392409 RepID=UPI0004B1931A|nr:cyclic pyranopterin monophosphate synthase MoaC [Sphingomonas jaspsi]